MINLFLLFYETESKSRRTSTPPSTPLPNLPSALLCPRHARSPRNAKRSGIRRHRPFSLDKPLKTVEKVVKFQKRQLLCQKKADYVTILIGILSICSCHFYSNELLDHICNCLNEILPLCKFQLCSEINAAQCLGTRKKPMHSTSKLANGPEMLKPT